MVLVVQIAIAVIVLTVITAAVIYLIDQSSERHEKKGM